ncbi:MAG: FtsW/RodA/SpoVE family cell cycle protein [Acutalibacteraceae bacterium]|nr:FtsW/RodA/SpoVE family cell cycle protein [Acutalibacteraceae bacterium]
MRGIWARIADYIREVDKIMFLLCLVTTSFGCMAVFSATHYTGSSKQFIMQVAAMVIGTGAAVFISLFDFEIFLKWWYVFAAIGLVPVLLTFVIGVGPAGTDDKAWLDLGFSTFQPSELMKTCFIITFAMHLTKVKDKINKMRYLIPVCFHGALPVALIHFQGDDGTALVFAVMVICMMWAAGVHIKYFIILICALIVAAPIIYFFVMNPDQQARIQNMFDIEADLQGTGWQQWRGRTALAGGGMWGQGFLKGSLTQMGKAGVPEGYNDFIFVTIGEELGFVGAFIAVLLLCSVCLRALFVAKLTNNFAGKLICVGFFGWMMAQVVINLGMCLSILPVIGITLPFFSAGGTSLSCLYMGVGLVLSVYMHRNSRTVYLHELK